jgi:hypothetical protein
MWSAWRFWNLLQRVPDLQLRSPGGSLDLFPSVQRVGQTHYLFKLA